MFLRDREEAPGRLLAIRVEGVRFVGCTGVRSFRRLRRTKCRGSVDSVVVRGPRVVRRNFAPAAHRCDMRRKFVSVLKGSGSGGLVILRLGTHGTNIATMGRLEECLRSLRGARGSCLGRYRTRGGRVENLLITPSVVSSTLRLLRRRNVRFISIRPPHRLGESGGMALSTFWFGTSPVFFGSLLW